MIHLAIDTWHNSVTVRDDASATPSWVHRFTRRWEALLLASLLEETRALRALSADSLQALLLQRGQSKPLNRAQLQRLLQSLQAFLAALPADSARIDTPPRKSTVGPWQLHHNGQLLYSIDGGASHDPWTHPSIVGEAGTDALYQALSALLVADALAVEGRYAPAIEVLLAADTTRLSPEGHGLVLLRLCSWYKHIGQFEPARACARKVLGLATSADPGLALYAHFFLERIDYDENPAEGWEHLWQTTREPPGHGVAPMVGTESDWRTRAEWHNLRALLARRRMLQIAGEPGRAQTGEDTAQGLETTASLHQLALRHLQAALYMGAWFRDWDRLQAYVANLAYHLQASLGVDPLLQVQVSQVLNWHRLTMAYEDKLGAGRDSAWEYIFFSKFWLDNHEAVEQAPPPDPLAHSLGNSSPDQASFYQRALDRLRECGDDRQVAIGHSLFLRFAVQHMPAPEGPAVVRSQTGQLLRLLGAQTSDQLLHTLVKEGYAAYWPPALQALTKLKPA